MQNTLIYFNMGTCFLHVWARKMKFSTISIMRRWHHQLTQLHAILLIQWLAKVPIDNMMRNIDHLNVSTEQTVTFSKLLKYRRLCLTSAIWGEASGHDWRRFYQKIRISSTILPDIDANVLHVAASFSRGQIPRHLKIDEISIDTCNEWFMDLVTQRCWLSENLRFTSIRRAAAVNSKVPKVCPGHASVSVVGRYRDVKGELIIDPFLDVTWRNVQINVHDVNSWNQH